MVGPMWANQWRLGLQPIGLLGELKLGQHPPDTRDPYTLYM